MADDLFLHTLCEFMYEVANVFTGKLTIPICNCVLISVGIGFFREKNDLSLKINTSISVHFISLCTQLTVTKQLSGSFVTILAKKNFEHSLFKCFLFIFYKNCPTFHPSVELFFSFFSEVKAQIETRVCEKNK